MKKARMAIISLALFLLIALGLSACDASKTKTTLKPDTSNSFEILPNGYARDDNYVYFTELMPLTEVNPSYYDNPIEHKEKYQIIIGADPNTFEVLEAMFGKDKDNVYCGLNHIKADPKSFKVLKNHYYYYGQDNKAAYDCKGKIGTTGGELIVLNWHYKKDKDHVYYGPSNKIVELADPESFEVVSTYEGRDKNGFYAYGKRNDNIDPSSYVSLGKFYAKDKNRVYLDYSILAGADPDSFQVMSGAYGKDKNNVFYMHHKIEDADNLSFKALSEVYAIDKDNVYCRNFIIKAADKDTFKASKNCSASDKNRSYDCHKCESYSQ